MKNTQHRTTPSAQMFATSTVTEKPETIPLSRTSAPNHQWFKLINIDAVKQGASRVQYAEKACFIVRDQQSFQVFDSICPHKTVNIPEDAIDGMILECPMHLWKFSLETGECLEKGTQTPLKKLTHKVEEGFLYLFV